jgi:hypothetical protein
MNIQIGKKFKLNQARADRFDLVQLVKKEKKDTGETYTSETVIGYDMRLETCISNIIFERLKRNTKTVKLTEFLAAYKKEKEKILNMLEENATSKPTRTRTK